MFRFNHEIMSKNGLGEKYTNLWKKTENYSAILYGKKKKILF